MNFRQWRINRLELQANDIEYDLCKWGFSLRPSQKVSMRKRIDRLRNKAERLKAKE